MTTGDTAATPTTAHRVWRNDVALEGICRFSDDATFTNIIRVDRQSFKIGVRCIWSEIDEGIDTVEGLLDGVEDINRYTPYLSAIREVTTYEPQYKTVFMWYIELCPHLEKLDITDTSAFGADLPAELLLEVLRTTNGAIARIRVDCNLERHILPQGVISKRSNLQSWVEGIRSLVPNTLPVDMPFEDWSNLAGDADAFTVEKFEEYGYEDHTRLVLKSADIQLICLAEGTQIANLARILQAGRIISVRLLPYRPPPYAVHRPATTLAKARNQVNACSTNFGSRRISYIAFPLATLDAVVRDVAASGHRHACHVSYEIDATSVSFVERNQWKFEPPPSASRPQRDPEISFLINDRSSIYESIQHRRKRLLHDKRWILELARLCVLVGGSRGEYSIEYRHTCDLSEPPAMSGAAETKVKGDADAKTSWVDFLDAAAREDDEGSEDSEWSGSNGDGELSGDSGDSDTSSGDGTDDEGVTDSTESDDSGADLLELHDDLTRQIDEDWATVFEASLDLLLFPKGTQHPEWARLGERKNVEPGATRSGDQMLLRDGSCEDQDTAHDEQ